MSHMSKYQSKEHTRRAEKILFLHDVWCTNTSRRYSHSMRPNSQYQHKHVPWLISNWTVTTVNGFFRFYKYRASMGPRKYSILLKFHWDIVNYLPTFRCKTSAMFTCHASSDVTGIRVMQNFFCTTVVICIFMKLSHNAPNEIYRRSRSSSYRNERLMDTCIPKVKAWCS